MAIRAWMDGDLRLAIRLLEWAEPNVENNQAKRKDYPKEWDFQAA